MNTQIQFQKNSNVLAADGKQLGKLERLVVNPETKILTGIVVRTGGLLSHEERVVPIESVRETSDGLIVLREDVDDLAAFAMLKERHVINEAQVVNELAASTKEPPIVTRYPVMGTPVMLPSQPLVTQAEQNIPEGTVAMKEGAKVITVEGKHVGNVERVIVDPSDEQVTHLVVFKRKPHKEAKLIPMQLVMTLEEDKIHLRVNQESVDELDNAPLAV
jgi:uncharacterized protein YrrD